MTRKNRKEEKDHVQREPANHAECREIQLLRDLRVRNLLLRLPEERVPLPGKQLPVRLPQLRRQPLTSNGLAHSMGGRGPFDANTL